MAYTLIEYNIANIYHHRTINLYLSNNFQNIKMSSHIIKTTDRKTEIKVVLHFLKVIVISKRDLLSDQQATAVKDYTSQP